MRAGLHAALAGSAAALLLCGANLAGQEPASAPQVTRRIKMFRTDTTMRDSNFVRVTINTDQIEQAIHQLIASKEMEKTIAQALREASSGQSGDSRRVRELSDQLSRIAQKNAALMSTIEMTCAGDRQAEGYLGVQFSQLQIVMGDEEPMASPLREYPKLDSVYSNSPASKAGLRRGDVVMMIGGQDARRPVHLDRLLKPATRVPIRVQRDGAQKDLTVVVEKKPADFNSECTNADQFISPEFDQPTIYLRTPQPMRAPRGGFTFPRMAMPATAPEAPSASEMPPMPPMPPMGGYTFQFSTANSAIAGATVLPLDDDWRATLGVDDGVLVTKVLPGTPSKDSGLRSGDVIVSADGQSVSSVRALSRIVGNAKANSVKLGIIRSGKPQTLVLRWKETSPERSPD